MRIGSPLKKLLLLRPGLLLTLRRRENSTNRLRFACVFARWRSARFVGLAAKPIFQRTARASFIAALLPVAVLLAGCPQAAPRTMLAPDVLVKSQNANAVKVPRLWARARMEVTLQNEAGAAFTWGSASSLSAPNGLLLMFKGEALGPHNFVLVGREVAGVELFRVGSSVKQGLYYFWYRFGENAGAWYGRHELAGAPGAKFLPLDPNQLLWLLGVCELPDDFLTIPALTVRMSRAPYAYVVGWIDRQPVSGRLGLRREVWLSWEDGKPARPFRVDFYDPQGRAVMTARLSKYSPIAGFGEKDSPAVMPTDIEIEAVAWPGDDRPNPLKRLHIVLSDMTIADKADPAACEFDPPVPPGKRHSVDEGVKMPGGDK